AKADKRALAHRRLDGAIRTLGRGGAARSAPGLASVRAVPGTTSGGAPLAERGGHPRLHPGLRDRERPSAPEPLRLPPPTIKAQDTAVAAHPGKRLQGLLR